MFSKKSNGPSCFLNVLFLLLLLSSLTSIAQGDTTQASSEEMTAAAYTDVWLPFMESYRELNIEKFKSLQAEDLTIVSIDRNTIQTKSTYFEGIAGFFNQFKQLNRQLDIKFSISSTATGESKIYQTGYYSVSSRESNSEPFKPMGYGYFTVVLIQENGSWKIALDADKQSAITEEEFRRSKVIYKLD